MVRQEEEEAKQGAAAAGTGEDQCRRNAYNRRLRATQSPKYVAGLIGLYKNNGAVLCIGNYFPFI